MIIMSLRVFEKQSPVPRGDCFLSGCFAIAKCARNDMWANVNALAGLVPFAGVEATVRQYERQENLNMTDIKYEIVKNIGVLSKAGSGWAKELNLISWNDREPKYDLRDWSPDHEKMGKGITLSKDELLALKELLNNMEL